MIEASGDALGIDIVWRFARADREPLLLRSGDQARKDHGTVLLGVCAGGTAGEISLRDAVSKSLSTGEADRFEALQRRLPACWTVVMSAVEVNLTQQWWRSKSLTRDLNKTGADLVGIRSTRVRHDRACNPPHIFRGRSKEGERERERDACDQTPHSRASLDAFLSALTSSSSSLPSTSAAMDGASSSGFDFSNHVRSDPARPPPPGPRT
jgi:hypothetical protein